ncbi:MAG TPA: hypothetical protein DCE41_02995 [Cytophagales bacterium]|nr:hypothetical protein [Cytophagales bacterium]
MVQQYLYAVAAAAGCAVQVTDGPLDAPRFLIDEDSTGAGANGAVQDNLPTGVVIVAYFSCRANGIRDTIGRMREVGECNLTRRVRKGYRMVSLAVY